MSVFELSKSIESVRLNKRNNLPLGEPPRIIPFGALVEDVRERGDRASFTYLGELYECDGDVLKSALGSAGASAAAGREKAESRAPNESRAPKQPPALEWETVESNGGSFSRARVPGGWLVASETKSIAFVPDADYRW